MFFLEVHACHLICIFSLNLDEGGSLLGLLCAARPDHPQRLAGHRPGPEQLAGVNLDTRGDPRQI